MVPVTTAFNLTAEVASVALVAAGLTGAREGSIAAVEAAAETGVGRPLADDPHAARSRPKRSSVRTKFLLIFMLASRDDLPTLALILIWLA